MKDQLQDSVDSLKMTICLTALPYCSASPSSQNRFYAVMQELTAVVASFRERKEVEGLQRKSHCDCNPCLNGCSIACKHCWHTCKLYACGFSVHNMEQGRQRNL